MTRRKKLMIAIAILVTLFFIVVGAVLPEVARRQAMSWVAENTSRQLSIDDVSFNPLNGKLTVTGYRLTEESSDEVFVAFDRLLLDVNISSVWKRAVIVDQLQWFNPRVSIVKIGDLEFNFSDFYSLRKESVEEKTGGEPLHFALNNFIVHGGSLDYRDVDVPDVVHTIRDFELALPFVGNTPALADKFVQPRLSLKVDNAPFVIEGEAKPFADSLEASLQIDLDNIDLPFYTAYLPKKRPIEVESGKLAVNLDLSYRVTQNKETKLLLGGDLALTGVSVVDTTGEKVFFLPLAQIRIDWADLLSQSAVIDEIALYGLEVFVKRNQVGEWNHERLAKEGSLPEDENPDEGEAEDAAEAVRSHLQLGQFRLRNGIIHFRDESGQQPFVRTLTDINIKLQNFDSLVKSSLPYQVDLRIAEPTSATLGSVAISGEVGLEPLRVEADIKTDKIRLAGIESYFPPDFVGLLADGHVDSELTVRAEMADELSADVTGTIGLRSLSLIEPVNKSAILSWESLQVDGLDVQLVNGEPAIRITELSLNNYLARILITAEGKVNLQQLQAEVDAEDAAGETTEAAPVEVPPAGPPPAVAVDHVTLQGGTLEFIDQHIPKNFNTRFINLGGRISGIDSGSEKAATVDLRGNLENRSPLRITGEIKPLGQLLYADLRIRFDSIEMTPMTPYSGNYLGYEIEKGKLYLDLEYKIDGETLSASNRVFLDQFTLGEEVESEEATSLPVNLAIALLKDGKGEIHLDLPVSGSLDDPEFSVVGVVFTVLKNLLVKAATAPFKLLGAMLGGGEEDFSTVSFPYGVATLVEPEKDKLAKLTDALLQRPALKLEVSGFVDREKDPEGLRNNRLEKALKQYKYDTLKRDGKLPKDVAVDSMQLTDKERSGYLKQIYKKADFPKPRNAIGLVKSLPDVEMEKLILANTPAGEAEMQQLAEARAKVVYEHLIKVDQLPVERVFLKQDDIYKSPDDEGASGSRVGFGATVD